jgi:AbrB family looped-hinge helix DNA binding protein
MVRSSLFLQEAVVRITSKGQVTIPLAIRERLGLLPNSEVDFEVVGNTVRIVKARGRRKVGRGRSLVQHLRARATTGLSTDQILAMTRGTR